MRKGGGISIWFFVGVSLLVNGLLITGAGAWEVFHPPANPVVLFRLHANLWWGAILFVLGVVYSLKFSPSRASS
jgi:FtsH-binding integral membrane protein